MSHLKFESRQPRTLFGMLKYAHQNLEAQTLGVNVSPFTAYEEMEMVKEAWRKTDGRKYKHYILSFEETVDLPAETLLEIGFKVAQPFAEEYQILISAHQDTDNLHLHFVQNTVNILTGEKLSLTKGDMLDLKIHANNVLAEYQLNPIELHDTPAVRAKMQSQSLQ